MTAEEGAAPPREQGWSGPIVAVILLLIVPTVSLIRIVVPIENALLLLAPVTAACAVAGWKAGGRFPLALLWSAFAVWVVWSASGAPGSYLDLIRGWSVLLALSFGAALALPAVEGFLAKGLLALGVALLAGTAVLLMVPGGPGGAVDLVTAEIGRRAIVATREWQQMTSTPEWLEMVRQSPSWGRYSEGVDRQLIELPAPALRLYPALFALQSLAVMALGWAVYHRVGRTRLGPPLAKLRDLRFNDALVWGVVAGLVLVAVPASGAASVVGINLLVFFGVLYALRGMGVIIWFLAPGRAMTVAFAIFTVIFWPVVGMVAAGLGLGDTWFDWRRRTRQESQRSE